MTHPEQLRQEIDQLLNIVGNESPSSLDELEEAIIALIDKARKEAVEEAFDRIGSMSMEPGGLSHHMNKTVEYMFPTPNDQGL